MKKIILTSLLFTGISNSDIFDDPENLKVLDKNITPVELRKTMRGFSMGLGVRCSHCHKGEEGKPIRTFDFASDEKDAKKTARLMLKMVNEINDKHISKINDSSIKVECVSCHRGQDKPQLTTNLLLNEHQSNGIQSVLSKYDELREKFYGSHTHDFSETMLLNVAEGVIATDFDSAIQLMKKNLKHYPKRQQTLFSLGRTYHKHSQFEKALNYYKKAQAIRTSPWLDNTIKELEANK